MPDALSSRVASPTRERILDAAATVMRGQGLARATTKAIAAEAGYSEALLYKHFADKQELYLAVLRERTGGYVSPAALIGQGELHANLAAATVQLMEFYVQTFPMSASIFSSPDLLSGWRDGMAARGGGPQMPLRNLERYLEGERELGRVRSTADAGAIAAALAGAAFQHAFLACFDGQTEVPDARSLAERLVGTLL